MYAWLSGEPGVENITWGEKPVPHPGNRELLTSVRAAAINFSDLLMIDDRYQVRPPRPFTPGQEIAGVVVAAGEGCQFGPGDRVASKVLWGGFAEYALIRDDMAIAIPEESSLDEAAALPISYTTAVVALTQSTHVESGETLLVHGASGGVGVASIQIGNALGAHVIATAGGPLKCEIARDEGAATVIDYSQEDFANRVTELTDGEGAHVVLDPVGGDVTLKSLDCLAWNGRLLIVGFASGSVAQIPAHRLLLKAQQAVGVYWEHDRDMAAVQGAQSRVLELLHNSQIAPRVDTHWSLHHAPEALSAMKRRMTTGKVVLTNSRSEK